LSTKRCLLPIDAYMRDTPCLMMPRRCRLFTARFDAAVADARHAAAAI